jgi:hypothetical protein
MQPETLNPTHDSAIWLSIPRKNEQSESEKNEKETKSKREYAQKCKSNAAIVLQMQILLIAWPTKT